ncbi:FAD/NAD(P)-binding protein [Streptomyces sp. TRM66268-LWL]|uniref:FAD/NAD(P)-binding protein n=1 Tax=Streptomyces polyasparticus TaxID=2767826 RepID=A0ABR7SBL1_9ACTN|nr:FAD/NAD(P)-binding protein [Streptomyces polyasparticus]
MPPHHRAIAVVGAGPRGTSIVERLCASAPALLPAGTRLTVHVIDPAPPGAGQVWRTDQPAGLLMNTVASQVTLYTDDSVGCEGPIRPGPSLHEWALRDPRTALGPDDYPTRALYGRYLEWVFAETVRTAPEHLRIQVHRARAIRLEDDTPAATGPQSLTLEDDTPAATGPQSLTLDDGTLAAPQSLTLDDGILAASQSLTLDDGTHLTGLDAVVLAQGHLPALGDRAQERLAAHAERHGLGYFPPANPADLDLSAIAPGEPVLLRGLGLNFFDHMALLTSGRGGRFLESTGGGLRYEPSGREPRLLAGSRRGVPYQARGDNEKGAHGRHLPRVLTDDVIETFRKRTAEGDPPDFLAEIWPLVAREVECVHYEALLAPERRPEFRERFLATSGQSRSAAELPLLLREFGIRSTAHWSWDRVSRPHHGRAFADPTDFRAWLTGHLREDAALAALGNVTGPVKAALDVLRDLRNELRRIVDHGGLTGHSRREHLDRWYTPLNAFLSIGPPRRRIEEMTALLDAGVLTVVGPRMQIRTEGAAFVAHSPDVPGSEVSARVLVEARLPEPDVRRTADPLLARLLKTGRCRPHVIGTYETGGLDVTPAPYRLIDRRGAAHPRRYAVGVPTEGVHWVTAAGARPGVDSVTLSDADAVARAVLGDVRAAGAPGKRNPAADRLLNLQAR